MERITEKHLEAVVARINRTLNAPAASYTRLSDGALVANIGNYHLSHAYGGVSLHRMVSEGGGVSDVLGIGHVPKRDLYHAMHAFLRGIDTASSANI